MSPSRRYDPRMSTSFRIIAAAVLAAYFISPPVQARKSESIVDQAVEAFTKADVFSRWQLANMPLQTRRPGRPPSFR